eukprot:3389266-Rhodomonas_salina.1
MLETFLVPSFLPGLPSLLPSLPASFSSYLAYLAYLTFYLGAYLVSYQPTKSLPKAYLASCPPSNLSPT